MSVVKINAITVPKDKQERFEERFRGRAGEVEKTAGFEWFELLRPLEGTDQYLVYTRWTSEEAYRAWEQGQDFARAHAGGGTTFRRRDLMVHLLQRGPESGRNRPGGQWQQAFVGASEGTLAASAGLEADLKPQRPAPLAWTGHGRPHPRPARSIRAGTPA